MTRSRSEPCGETVVEPGVRGETLMYGATERRLVDVSCPLSQYLSADVDLEERVRLTLAQPSSKGSASELAAHLRHSSF